MSSDRYCPLCHESRFVSYSQHENIQYYQCEICSVVFASKQSRLDEEQEKERYDLHKNSPDDLNYRKFLSKVLDPVCKRISKGALGLDFGSGPGPTLSIMFQEQGYNMNIYDYYYAKNDKVLQQRYDFITSTEVVEHLYEPKTVLEYLWSILKEGGVLAILTQPYPNKDKFSSWYYKNDPTHVCFFSIQSMQWLQNRWNARLEIIGKDLFIFKKGENGN